MSIREERISCDLCGKSLKGVGSLRSHKQYFHSNEPKTCNQCGLEFPNGMAHFKHVHERSSEKEEKDGVQAKGRAEETPDSTVAIATSSVFGEKGQETSRIRFKEGAKGIVG